VGLFRVIWISFFFSLFLLYNLSADSLYKPLNVSQQTATPNVKHTVNTNIAHSFQRSIKVSLAHYYGISVKLVKEAQA